VTHPIVIVGAGPAGLACALELACQGVPCTLFEAGEAPVPGSRATGVSRRTLQLLGNVGLAERVVEVSITQRGNQAFFGTSELFTEWTQPEPGKYPRIVNIPQDSFEEILLAEVAARPLIDLRWGHRVESVRPGDAGVSLGVRRDGESFEVEAEWLVVCDGARSGIRRSLGLRLQGVAFDTRFIVTDVRARLDLPEGVRRIWFDPPSNPGGTIIMHQQPPGDVWRIDFGLPLHETTEAAFSPASVHAKVEAHLELLGAQGDWEVLWESDYTASSVSLPSFRHGRVFFAGDAAHLIPIFGGRGLNSAVEDGFNLGWKLAAVASGEVGDQLLDTYSAERAEGARQNSAKAEIGAEVIAARSPTSLLLRRAALCLMLERRPALTSLLDHRTSDANTYPDSPLHFEQWGAGPERGCAPGDAALDMLAGVRGGSRSYLSDLFGTGFTVLEVGSVPAAGDGATPAGGTLMGLPVTVISIEPTPHDPEGGEPPYETGAYLIRPDRYVMGRIAGGGAAAVLAAARQLSMVETTSARPVA